MKDEHVNDAAQDAAEDVAQDVAQILGSGARAARALISRHATTTAAAVFVQLNWAARWHLARAVGKRPLPGVPHKAPLC